MTDKDKDYWAFRNAMGCSDLVPEDRPDGTLECAKCRVPMQPQNLPTGEPIWYCPKCTEMWRRE